MRHAPVRMAPGIGCGWMVPTPTSIPSLKAPTWHTEGWVSPGWSTASRAAASRYSTALRNGRTSAASTTSIS